MVTPISKERPKLETAHHGEQFGAQARHADERSKNDHGKAEHDHLVHTHQYFCACGG